MMRDWNPMDSFSGRFSHGNRWPAPLQDTGEGSDSAVGNHPWLLSKSSFWLQLPLWSWLSNGQRILVATLPHKLLFLGFPTFKYPLCSTRNPLNLSKLISILSCPMLPYREQGKGSCRICKVCRFRQCFELLSWWRIFVTSGVHPAKEILGEGPVDPVQLSTFTHPWKWVFIFVFR